MSARRWAAGILVLAAAAVSIFLTRPPSPASADAPVESFSADRAFRHVEAIAKEPHPAGSEENRRVREYIIEELRALGLEPSLQIINAWTGSRPPGVFTNIIALLPGHDNTRRVILAAHHDSHPLAPGAGDDGAAVAAMIETARALREGPPLRNDIVFLLTDGEEVGLVGARAFEESHPLAKEPAVVLNFEGRGSAGPVYMFETAGPNRRLVRVLARAVSRPTANSLMAEIYRRMPNNTDLTVFRRAGIPGLNFGMIDGSRAYHTPLDTPENLSKRSLQHHGSLMLAMARRLGSRGLSKPGQGRVVYFDFLSRYLVVYPEGLVWPLTIGAAVLFLAIAAGGLRSGRLTGRGIAAGAGALLAALVVSTLLAFGVGRALYAVLGDRVHRPVGGTTGDPWFFLAVSLLSLAVTSWVFRRTSSRVGKGNLAVGALLVWLLLLVGASAAMPGATFLFLWPLVLALLGLAGALRLDRDWAYPRRGPLIAALIFLPAVLVIAPLVHGFFVAMALRSLWIPVPVLVLTLGALAPVLDGLTFGKKTRVPLAATAFAALLIVVGVVAA